MTRAASLERSCFDARNGRRHVASLAALACLLANLSGASYARAYSDPNSYELPVLEGGGGGRWFTGSPADGFGCDVCHDATATLVVSVTGLPLDAGYVAGQAYELGVSWPSELEHLALVLELVDSSGMRAGSIEVPQPEANTPDELCSKEGAEGFPASGVIDSPSGRQFATVIDCGSRSLRMRWTAPSTAMGTLWLTGGLVGSNDDARVDGDVAVMIRRPFPVAGSTLPAIELTEESGCSVGLPGSKPRGWGLAAWVGAGWVLCWRGRRKAGRE